MPRTAPAPNLIAIPGMDPCMFVMAGGMGGGGGGGSATEGEDINARDPEAGSGGVNTEADLKVAKACGPGTTQCPGPHGGGGTSAGHPIDYATGAVYTISELEVFLPGPLPFEFYRAYSSLALRRNVGMGWGWAHSFAFFLEERSRRLMFHKPDGRMLEMEALERDEVRAFADGWQLTREKWGYRLSDHRGLAYLFHDKHQTPKTSTQGPVHRVSALLDRNGNEILLAYEGAKLTQITDTAQRTVRLTYNPAGLIAALDVVLPTGQVVNFMNYAYDEESDLVRATDAAGHSVRYAYEKHRLVREESRAGLVAEFRYDQRGRGVETWCTHRAPEKLGLVDDAPSLLADERTRAKGILHCKIDYMDDYVEIVDSRQVRRVFLGPQGKVGKASLGEGVFEHVYDNKGRELAYIDPEEAKTVFERDLEGRLVRVINSRGIATTFGYAYSGDVETISGPTRKSTFLYDNQANVTSIIDNLGELAALNYDERGLLLEVRLPSGWLSQARYDISGNRVEVTEPSGTKKIEFDGLGRPTSVVNEEGHRVRFTYTLGGHLDSLTRSDGERVLFSYDEEGRCVRVTDPEGRSYKFEWGAVRSLLSVEKPNGKVVKALYDRETRLAAIINEAGEEHRFERNAAGLVIAEKTFDGRTVAFSMSRAGRPKAIREASGNRLELTYDKTGNVIGRSFDDDSEHAFVYDECDRAIAGTAEGAKVIFEYDVRGRTTVENAASLGDECTLETRVYSFGKRLSLKSSWGHTLRIERDPRGYPTKLILDEKEVVEQTWSQHGKLLSRAAGSFAIHRNYDACGRLLRQRLRNVAAAESLVIETTWAYDRSGALVGRADNRLGDVRFSVDASRQLLGMRFERQPQRDEIFSYGSGERVVRATPKGHDRSYAPGGRIQACGGFRYVYDADGRLSERRQGSSSEERVWLYEWNARGLLSKVELPNGESVKFGYDAFDRRVRKEFLSAVDELLSTTHYVWDRTRLLAERTRSGKVTRVRHYVTCDVTNEVVAHRDCVEDESGIREDEWIFYANGLVQEPLHGFTGDLRVVSHVTLSAWGEALGEAFTPIRFQGQYHDVETGLHYNRYRYYEPSSGRYISPDPLRAFGALDPYAYADNRPQEKVDPLGLVSDIAGLITARTAETGVFGDADPANAASVDAIDEAIMSGPDRGPDVDVIKAKLEKPQAMMPNTKKGSELKPKCPYCGTGGSGAMTSYAQMDVPSAEAQSAVSPASPPNTHKPSSNFPL